MAWCFLPAPIHRLFHWRDRVNHHFYTGEIMAHGNRGRSLFAIALCRNIAPSDHPQIVVKQTPNDQQTRCKVSTTGLRMIGSHKGRFTHSPPVEGGLQNGRGLSGVKGTGKCTVNMPPLANCQSKKSSNPALVRARITLATTPCATSSTRPPCAFEVSSSSPCDTRATTSSSVSPPGGASAQRRVRLRAHSSG